MKRKQMFLEFGCTGKVMRGFVICSIILFPFFSKAQNLVSGKIPIDTTRWYQANNTQNTVAALFNGVLQENINLGYGLIFSNWDAFYPVLPGEIIQLEQIKMYDWQGVFTSTPVTIYVIDDKWQKTQIGRFTGPNYGVWTGPYPDSPNQFTLNTPVTNIKYIVINTYGNLPTEIEFYGKYQAPSPIVINQPTVPLKNMLGVNGYEWNFLKSDGYHINLKSFQLAQSFTGFRHYLDWQKLEDTEGSYTYNPCYSGSWNLDTLYATAKQDSMEVLACIKTIPNWMYSTYPLNRQNAENVPLKFGRDYSLPSSYIEQAKLAFQFAARYGSNKNVNPALLSVNQVPRWTNDLPNTVKIGLNQIKYIECNNETDKWWKGRDAYQMGREYAANLSAFYDGNLNTMGPGIGAKNADPNIKIVMAGTASTTTDYVRGMIDWCAQFRGYLSDGTINYCWDVINYHFYSNNAQSSQLGNNATSGTAPEFANFELTAQNFVKMAAIFGNNMPIWLTETGYDINPTGSTQFAPAIGNKSILETQADWILRTALLAARNGISKLFYYQMYDDNSFGGQYGTSGLLSATDSSRRPAAQYLFQLKQNFGEYVFKESINHNPEVDRYEYNKQSMFVVWNPTQSGATSNYSLQFGKIDSASIYSPNSLGDTMNVSIVRNITTSLPLTATETPIFVFPFYHQIDLLDFAVKTVNGHHVGLGWSVSNDSTVQQFTIEKMDEATKTFSSIATIAPNKIRSTKPNYSYIDSFANKGLNHYRLKTTMSNYGYIYSNIDKAYVGSLVCYPNPFSSSITIEGLFEGKTTLLKVISMDGAIVKMGSTNGNIYQWYLGSLPEGIYTLVIDDGTNHDQIRMGKMPAH